MTPSHKMHTQLRPPSPFPAHLLVCAAALAASTALARVTPDDLAASPVARLAQAIEDGDAHTVAAAVRYPLERPYPLPPVNSPEEFAARFSLIFDGPFRQRMREGSFAEDWSDSAWHGASYLHGELWLDDSLAHGGKIYAVNHVSDVENRLRDGLVAAELATLPPSLDGPCDPQFSFLSDDGSVAGRVDRLPNGSFRVALFDGPVLSGRPLPRGSAPIKARFDATRVHEGSGGDHVFLDPCNLLALYVHVIGSDDTPELELYERSSWADAFPSPLPAHRVPWQTLLAPPGQTQPKGTP